MWLGYLADAIDRADRDEQGNVLLGNADCVVSKLREIAARMRGPHWYEALKAELDDAMKQPK